MSIQKLNVNSSLETIIERKPDGREQSFLLKHPCKKEIDYLVYYSDVLRKEGIIPFIRVKYNWEFGQRPRVLDIVGLNENRIILFKRSNVFSIDNNVLDLTRIKENIQSKYPNLNIEICLILSRHIDKRIIESTLDSLGILASFRIII